MKSMHLPHCWVCQRRFTDVDPPGPENREEHHIIPRQAGGLHGPTVSLCERHHGILHKIAANMNSKNPKPYGHLVADLDPEQQKKILWLSATAANAFKMTKDDPNKKRVVVLTLNPQLDAMLKRLQSIYPQLRSREQVLQVAVESLYNKHFFN